MTTVEFDHSLLAQQFILQKKHPSSYIFLGYLLLTLTAVINSINKILYEHSQHATYDLLDLDAQVGSTTLLILPQAKDKAMYFTTTSLQPSLKEDSRIHNGLGFISMSISSQNNQDVSKYDHR